MPATAELIGAAAALFGLGILTLLSVRSITRNAHRSDTPGGVPPGPGPGRRRGAGAAWAGRPRGRHPRGPGSREARAGLSVPAVTVDLGTHGWRSVPAGDHTGDSPA